MDQTATPFEALQAAVTRAGSQTAFAKLCSVSQPTVWRWVQSSKRLPAEHVLVVEETTGVSRHLLRPDIYPVGLRSSLPEDEDLHGDAPTVPCGRGVELQRSAA